MDHLQDQDINQENPDSTCVICLEDNINTKSLLVTPNYCECVKFYHIECFLDWYQQNQDCPICRTKIPISHITTFIYNKSEDVWEDISLESLVKIIDLYSAVEDEENIAEVSNNDVSINIDRTIEQMKNRKPNAY